MEYLEIAYLDQENAHAWRRLADATFVMVARLLEDGKAGVVNRMNPETEDDVLMLKKGDLNKQLRKRKIDESLFKAWIFFLFTL